MPEIGTSGSMSGDRKRSVAEWPKLPRPSSALPFRTSRHVRSSVAIGGKADVARTPRFGGEGPLADIETITGNPRGCFAWAVPPFGSVLTQPFWYPVMYWRCCRF